MTDRLDRFLIAQNARHAGYDSALGEIKAGRKRSHWIWYIFPQLAGLGQSSAAHTYGISGREEALAYLCHPTLRDRLLEIARAVADQLRGGAAISMLMGSDIDARKLVSSMTLFRATADGVDADVAETARQVLAYAGAQGYPPCEFTQATLQRSR